MDFNHQLIQTPDTIVMLYTRPWTEKMRLLRQQLAPYGLLEEACHEDNQDLVHTRAIQKAAQGKK